MKNITLSFFILMLFAYAGMAQSPNEQSDSLYRPKVHFSPKQHWINDPNGMVFYNGLYHLFYQYHPYSSVWGPMHWGHATSKDLTHWNELPIAIYPDSIGDIFSGSAVVDENNTSGFGKEGKTPLVAIFTQHNIEGEKRHTNTFQNQSIAYSTDGGNTWIKYKGNPVLKSPGMADFRDPKVIWYEPQKKWIMTLATKDRVTFYSSKNLKEWVKESEFGAALGAHGGVWECPDLFELNDNGKKIWVLIVSLNPNGPNGGSGTQYFLGKFDGHQFVASHKDTRWIDYGPDNYAGVTWSNTGHQKIFIGWMSNWSYARELPTNSWRNAMTIPRQLGIVHTNGKAYLASQPVAELMAMQTKPVEIINTDNFQKSNSAIISIKFPCHIQLEADTINDFSMRFYNSLGEELIIGYDKKQHAYFVDRTHSGKTNFQENFSGRFTAPRLANNSKISISLLLDNSSVELFADNGVTNMTTLFFPTQPYTNLDYNITQNATLKKLEYTEIKSASNLK